VAARANVAPTADVIRRCLVGVRITVILLRGENLSSKRHRC